MQNDILATRVALLSDAAADYALLLCMCVDAPPVVLIPLLVERVGAQRLTELKLLPGVDGVTVLAHMIDQGTVDDHPVSVLLPLLGDALGPCLEGAKLVLTYTTATH